LLSSSLLRLSPSLRLSPQPSPTRKKIFYHKHLLPSLLPLIDCYQLLELHISFTLTCLSEQSLLHFSISRSLLPASPNSLLTSFEASVNAPSLQPPQLSSYHVRLPPSFDITCFACSFHHSCRLRLRVFTFLGPSLLPSLAYISLFPFHHNLFLFHPLHTSPSSTPPTLIHLLQHLSSHHIIYS
jgi:hypothetical protein